jgi:hypothetical protein
MPVKLTQINIFAQITCQALPTRLCNLFNKEEYRFKNIFYIPTKESIKVHLNNFIPQQPDVFFKAQTLYHFGEETANTASETPYIKLP